MIDIIIITYNAKNKLKRCLESVEKHTKGTRYSLTVVNNNSTDGTFQFLRTYKQKKIKIINNDENLGFCGAANIALNKTSNKFIVFLDDDAEVTKDWLKRLYQQIKNKPEIGIVGCKVIYPNNIIFSAENRANPMQIVGNGEIDRGQRDYIKECDAIAGTCWLMRRELVDKVGYFDEIFFPSQCEDLDYCLRTRLVGYKIIYNGKVKIIHHHLFRDSNSVEKNRRRFFRKWTKDVLRKFPLRDSHPVDKYIAKGVGNFKKNIYKQALIEFKKAESFDKRFSEPFYMGIALEGMGKYNDAIQQFKKVLNLNSSNFLARYSLVLLYKKIGLVKEAKREATKMFDFILSNKKTDFY